MKCKCCSLRVCLVMLCLFCSCEKVQLPSDIKGSSLQAGETDGDDDEEDDASAAEQTFDNSWGYNSTFSVETGEMTDTAAVDNLTMSGNGSFGIPYTIYSFIGGTVYQTLIGNQVTSIDDIWVTGYIVGYISGRTISKTVFDAGNVASNVVLAATPEITNYALCVPVQLSSSYQVTRSALNLRDNPAMLGKKVTICGRATTYMSCFGVKNVKSYAIK